ncbi:MAG TPA: hypothetical protein PKJ16_03730 [Spirochaetota bacterium]|nr:hypothetical protein [Spirochaetota bacterium]HOS39878.1 hypothetical protein [Spirochaetota bacterium]HPU90073.1 hypothetical protein [Spirochaetota bacterium]
MKKTIMLILFVFVLSVLFGACNSKKTELQFVNSPDSPGPINDIIWANGDAQFSQANGFPVNESTASMEVTELNGRVEAKVLNGSEFVTGNVVIPKTNSSSLSLSEGSANKYTIKVNP